VDFLDWMRMVFALIATLSLIAGAAYLARRFNLFEAGGVKGPERRMRVRESLVLDARRRLVLVRCDAREHLLLLSPVGDVVVAGFDAPPEELKPEPSAEPTT
jgi:flagellar protein FliO/FliZ